MLRPAFMRRAQQFLCTALVCAGPCSAQSVLLDSFNAGSAIGAVRADTSWAGNATQNAATVTIAGTALNENGWGAAGLSLNATGTTFLTIAGQRDPGHLATVFAVQLEDAALNTQVFYISASAFAVGVLTQVQVPLPAWTGGFSPAQIASWSVGGGGVGSAAFRMTLDHLAFTTTAASGAVFAPVGASTLSSPLAGTGGLTLNGAGTLVLGDANSFSGAVTLQQGTLRLGAVGALPVGNPASIAAGTTLDLNGFAATVSALDGAGAVALGTATLGVAQSGDATFSGAISGAGGLAKSGVGTLTLSGTNHFTGPTSISGGQLKVTGSATGSAFTVSGGVLSGNGIIGALTVANGGTVSPGNSPGTLSTGAEIWSGGGSYLWEINATAAAGGAQGQATGWDLLSISGALTINATSESKFNIDLTSLNGVVSGHAAGFDSTANYSFTFVSAGSISGFSAEKFNLVTNAFTNPFTGSWSIAQSGSNLTLNYASAIPEPATYALMIAVAGLLIAGSRRAWGRR